MLKSLLLNRIRAFHYSLASDEISHTTIARKMLLIFIAAVFVIMCFFILFKHLFTQICQPLLLINLNWFYFAVACILAFLFSFMGNVLATQSEIYEAKDNELLLSLPIKMKYILGSRMLALLILNLIYVLLVMIPAAVVYLKYESVNFLGIIYFLIGCFLLPLLVQSFSCIMAWFFSVIGSKLKNTNLVTLLFLLIFISLYIFAYLKTETIVNRLISEGEIISFIVKKYAFPFYYLGIAITSHNLTYLLLFTVCVLSIFEFIYFSISKSFLFITFHYSNTKKTFKSSLSYNSRNIKCAFLIKDFKLFFKNSIFVINALFGLIMLLLISCWSLFLNNSLIINIVPVEYTEYGCYVLISSILGLSALNFIACPLISMEGNTREVTEALPVNKGSMIFSKTYVQYIICIPATFVCSFIMLRDLKINIYESILCLGIIIIGNVNISLFQTWIGVLFPKYKYENEISLINRNPATLICFGASIVVIIITSFIAIMLTEIISNLICLFIYFVLNVIIFYVLKLIIRNALNKS